MNEILAVLTVIGLFMIRIGIPILLLVGLGLLIDRWQTKRAEELRLQMQLSGEKADSVDEHQQKDEDKEKRKVA